MKHTINKNNGFTIIEIAIVIAIIATIVSVLFRLIYGKEIQKWSASFWNSLGINPIIPNIVIGIVVALYFINKYFFSTRNRIRKKD